MNTFTAILLVLAGGFWYWLGFMDASRSEPTRIFTLGCRVAQIVGVITAAVGVIGWVYFATHNAPN